MKRFYRILALVLVAAALLTTGCGNRIGRTDKEEKQLSNPVTVSSLVEVMVEQLWKQQSVEFRLSGGIDAATDSGNGMMDVVINLDVPGELVTNPIQLHINGNVGLNMMGMDMGLPVEAYVMQEAEAIRLFIGIMGQWMTQSVDVSSDQIDQMLADAPEFTLNEEALAHISLNGATELIEGKECYRLDLVLSEEELQAFAEGVAEGIANRGEMGGTTNPDVGMSLWIDAQTILPVRLSMGMNSTIETESFILRSIKLQADFTGYNTVAEIIVPDEVVNNAEPADIASSLPL